MPYIEKVFSYEMFNQNKNTYEKGIVKFKQNNNVDEGGIGRYRKRIYSVDIASEGSYYLYNWISPDEYPCEKPPAEERKAHVVYEILNCRWAKALQLVGNLPKTLETSALLFILRGFKTLDDLLRQEGQYFQDHFLNRPKFQIIYKASSDSIGGLFVYLNVFEEESKKKFKELKSFPRKVECLRMNLDYLVKFAGSYEVASGDDYLVLAFRLLGNQWDQN